MSVYTYEHCAHTRSLQQWSNTMKASMHALDRAQLYGVNTKHSYTNRMRMNDGSIILCIYKGVQYRLLKYIDSLLCIRVLDGALMETKGARVKIGTEYVAFNKFKRV